MATDIPFLYRPGLTVSATPRTSPRSSWAAAAAHSAAQAGSVQPSDGFTVLRKKARASSLFMRVIPNGHVCMITSSIIVCIQTQIRW